MVKEAEIRNVHVERYYPNVLAGAKEFKAIAIAENPELKLLWQKAWKWYLNTFVLDLDEQGAARWEQMLKLYPKSDATLDDRRRLILAKINTMLPYTYRRMEQILNSLCGEGLYEIDLDSIAGTLEIVANPDITLGMNQISGILRPIIPANLAFDIVIKIIQQWKIQYRAEAMQFVESHQCIWNLGTAEIAHRDGEFRRDKTTRRNGINPLGNWRQQQVHRTEIDLLVDSHMDGSARKINMRDGAYRRDGSHRRNGGYLARNMIAHCCTITYIKNGVEVTENV